MHVAIALGTVLLGGWVLDPPADVQPTVPQAPAVAPVMPHAPVSPMSPADRNRGREGGDQSRGRMLPGSPTPGEETPNTQLPRRQMPRAQGQAQGQGVTGPMPSSPTEPAVPGAEGASGEPQSPTASGAQSSTTGTGASAASATPLYGPLAPTASQRPSLSPGAPPFGSTLQSSRPMMIGANNVTPPTDKAFSTYRPTSGVSPWMNLFRRDTLGTVDNYTSLVRPQIDQNALNPQFRRDIHRLDRNTSQLQGTVQQQLDLQNRTLQGVATPQFYMNYGNYYPNQGQRFGQ